MKNVKGIKRVFVGNIPYDYDDKSIKDILSLVGPVQELDIKFDETTKKSRGFGFCYYFDEDVARSALRNLNNIDYKGRQLRVNIQDHDRGNIMINEDIFKANKDISYLKKENEGFNMNNVLKNMSDEQKLCFLYTCRTLMLKSPNEFNKLLENQDIDMLDAIIELQNSFLDKHDRR